jgi:hypothetical protein
VVQKSRMPKSRVQGQIYHPAIKNLDPKYKCRKPVVKNLDTKSKPYGKTMVDSDSRSESSNPVQLDVAIITCIQRLKSMHIQARGFVDLLYEPCMPYDAIDSCIMTAVYGVDPYHSVYVSSPNGTGTVAVIWMLLGCRYGNSIQPYYKVI